MSNTQNPQAQNDTKSGKTNQKNDQGSANRTGGMQNEGGSSSPKKTTQGGSCN